jgi:uncharacterized membrane-anchored protein
LIGWAAPPRYEQTAHKLYWAKELSFGGDTEHTLNYDIRALGRRGVLSLNAVASMDRLRVVEANMKEGLGAISFNQGHRYEDYTAGVDKVATYGLGALIVGAIATKAGLFKILLGLLIAGKKFVLLALVAIGEFLKKIFSGRRKEASEPGVAE